MYTIQNFKSKKALREAIAEGKAVGYFQPGPFGGKEPQNGTITLEGPHYPEPHRWYALAEVVNGRIVKVQ